jgi:hypothetical protein
MLNKISILLYSDFVFYPILKTQQFLFLFQVCPKIAKGGGPKWLCVTQSTIRADLEQKRAEKPQSVITQLKIQGIF